MINLELERLYIEDKQDRIKFDKGQLSRTDLQHNDIDRQVLLQKILPSIDRSEIWNCHYACLLLMHSLTSDPNTYKLAHEFAEKAIELGSNVTRWLYAASLDRWLISQGKKQKFGTQFNIESGIICDYDSSTTDIERKKFGVPPLAKLLIRNYIRI